MMGMVGQVENQPGLAGPAAGERALMRAVLEDALRCVTGDVGPARDRAERAAEARTWVGASDHTRPFSFENICDALGLCAERLRTRILKDAPEVVAPAADEAARTRRPRRPTPSEQDIIDMIRQGQPLRVVAETFGISISKASILSCGLASRIKAERDERIRDLRQQGWTYRALAGQFGLSRIRVMRICARREPAEAERTAA